MSDEKLADEFFDGLERIVNSVRNDVDESVWTLWLMAFAADEMRKSGAKLNKAVYAFVTGWQGLEDTDEA